MCIESSDESPGQNRLYYLLIALVLFGLIDDACLAADTRDDAYRSYVRFDNDILAESDQGYSNGIELGFVSPTVARFDDADLAAPQRWLNRYTSWLQPQGFDENNMVVSITQSIYTPGDSYRTDVIETDRPYAGVFTVGVGYNGRDTDSMHSTFLHVGVVGPAALGEEVQDFAHNLVGTHKFSGWDNQLSNEPVVRVLHQRRKRWSDDSVFDSSLHADFIAHGGGSMGNLATYANVGAEIRVGAWLPDNFGSAPSLPAMETAAPTRPTDYTQTLQFHAFVIVDLRAVLHDITLDGNTWQDSHSVDRESLVADVGFGIAAHWQGWKIALARYVRTREFDGQEATPQLGSLTIRREI